MLSPEALRRFVGPPLQDSFAAVCGPNAPAAVAAYREYFADRGIFENSVYDGIPGLLAALRGAGVRLAVATSKPTVFAVRILAHFALDPFFEVVRGAELGTARAGTSTR